MRIRNYIIPCKKHVRAITLNVVLLVVACCIEPYQVSSVLTDYNYLVIDGFLVSGNDSTIIKLSRTTTLSNSIKDLTESNALVQIEDEAGKTYTLNEKSKGTYALAPMSFDTSLKHRLHIRTKDNKEYMSDFVSILQSPMIDKVNWKEEQSGIQTSIDAHDSNNATKYYLWKYEETWKYTSTGFSIYVYKEGEILPRKYADELYYCWLTEEGHNISIFSTQSLGQDIVSNFPLITIPSNSRKLMYGYSLLVKQHAISKQAFEYWSLLLKNNENLGTLFDPMPSRDIGNFHSVNDPTEPVLGYFSASTIATKRIYIDRQQLQGPSSGYELMGLTDCKGEIILLKDLANKLPGNLIIDKRFDDVTQEFIGYSVAPAQCIDCRKQGGVITKPDYWP
jgi:hypothetical protein